MSLKRTPFVCRRKDGNGNRTDAQTESRPGNVDETLSSNAKIKDTTSSQSEIDSENDAKTYTASYCKRACLDGALPPNVRSHKVGDNMLIC